MADLQGSKASGVVSSQPGLYHSEFGGYWTDRRDADAMIDRKLEAGEINWQEGNLLRLWIKHGYAVLPGAVAPELCDQVVDALHRGAIERDPRFRVLDPNANARPLGPDFEEEFDLRLVDAYVHIEAALQALLSPDLVRFLALIYEQPPHLFQGLSFHRGSQQGIHQDTAYVVSSDPMKLAASWIALEDVQPGSGELMYYEGSHRLPEYKFSGQHKHWSPERDGLEQHAEWGRLLHENAQRLGMPLRRFQPRKGDVFIWSADLAHGGSPIADKRLTRKSLVGHYCPIDAHPFYFEYLPERRTTSQLQSGRFSSQYFDLAGPGELVVP
jgi:phytanoyl-CoA hydroxylase